MVKVLSVINNKGGVGKTTLTHLLASSLAINYDKKVLMIDFDSQASLSSIYQIFTNNVSDVLLGNCSVRESIVQVSSNGPLYLIPGSPDLAKLEREVKDNPYVLKSLTNELRKSEFDFIFVDVGPTLGLLQLNVLNAIDEAIISLTPSYLDWAGLELLLKTIDDVKVSNNPSITVKGVILNQFDGRSNHSKDIKQYLEENYNLLGTVSGSVVVKNAYLDKKSLCEFEPRHKINNQIKDIIERLDLL